MSANKYKAGDKVLIKNLTIGNSYGLGVSMKTLFNKAKELSNKMFIICGIYESCLESLACYYLEGSDYLINDDMIVGKTFTYDDLKDRSIVVQVTDKEELNKVIQFGKNIGIHNGFTLNNISNFESQGIRIGTDDGNRSSDEIVFNYSSIDWYEEGGHNILSFKEFELLYINTNTSDIEELEINIRKSRRDNLIKSDWTYEELKKFDGEQVHIKSINIDLIGELYIDGINASIVSNNSKYNGCGNKKEGYKYSRSLLSYLNREISYTIEILPQSDSPSFIKQGTIFATCINDRSDGGYKLNITEGKIYTVINETPRYINIENDIGNTISYLKNRFKLSTDIIASGLMPFPISSYEDIGECTKVNIDRSYVVSKYKVGDHVKSYNGDGINYICDITCIDNTEYHNVYNNITVGRKYKFIGFSSPKDKDEIWGDYINIIDDNNIVKSFHVTYFNIKSIQEIFNKELMSIYEKGFMSADELTAFKEVHTNLFNNFNKPMYKAPVINDRINAKFFTDKKIDSIVTIAEAIEVRVEQTSETIEILRVEKSKLERLFSRLNDAVENKDIKETEIVLKDYEDFLAEEAKAFEKETVK